MINKIKRTGIRVVVFFILYFALYTIPYYTNLGFFIKEIDLTKILTLIIAYASFLLSKSITNHIVIKFLPDLIEKN